MREHTSQYNQILSKGSLWNIEISKEIKFPIWKGNSIYQDVRYFGYSLNWAVPVKIFITIKKLCNIVFRVVIDVIN